jgi:hypothetical protein
VADRLNGGKKKRKWPKVLAWTGGILVVLTAAGLFALNMAIEKMLGSLGGLEGIDAGVVRQISEPTGKGGHGDPSSDADGGANPDSPAGTGDAATNNGGSGSSSPGGTGGNAGSDGTAGNPAEQASNSETNASPGQGQPDDASSELAYSAEVSAEKAQLIQEKVTVGEKRTITSILIKRLDASDISWIMELASDGLSVEDKRAIRAVLLDKLTEEEYDTLIAIAQKYGLSQGKKYAEVKGSS